MIPIPQFSPKNSLAGVVAGLFQNNEPGVWYDPSDFSTMFQDAAGTTPVTAVEQPVGLILDKSKGLVLGPELVENGDFSNGTTGWTLGAGWGVSGGVATCNGTNAATSYLTATIISPGFTVGNFYQVSFSYSVTTGRLRINSGAVGVTPTLAAGKSGTYATILPATAVGDFRVQAVDANTTCSVDNISVRELPGNHAYQTTTTSRPVLSARYNLLTKTEQFDDAAWSKTAATVTQNAVVSPDGTTTADKLISDASTNWHLAWQDAIPANVSVRFSVYAKAAEETKLALSDFSGNTGCTFDLSAVTATISGSDAALSLSSGSISSVGNGWYLCSVTMLATATKRASIYIRQFSASYTGDGTSGIYIWGASLVPANQASLPYQRVNTATDYDSDPAKFKPYLVFDGIDDWLVTPTITPGIDKVQVFAGVRKLSDAALAVAAELGTGAQNGSFLLAIPANAGPSLQFFSRGTANAFATVNSGYAAPITNVVTGLGDVFGDQAILRANGAQVASSTADQGTGNYGNYPLYIGRRAGTALPFNGHLYSLIVRFGNNLPIGTIENTEKYMNLKTAATDRRDVTDSSSFRWNSATASPDAE